MMTNATFIACATKKQDRCNSNNNVISILLFFFFLGGGGGRKKCSASTIHDRLYMPLWMVKVVIHVYIHYVYGR